ncbi:MAG: hypothetical protein MRECE_8c006 [Mycoplasmataceae bacterium CE_OT135]|nr:MAG: hypothetical protein MRECE_8c006 [Mycoplasmataceae bacterium CE_OT135]
MTIKNEDKQINKFNQQKKNKSTEFNWTAGGFVCS